MRLALLCGLPLGRASVNEAGILVDIYPQLEEPISSAYQGYLVPENPGFPASEFHGDPLVLARRAAIYRSPDPDVYHLLSQLSDELSLASQRRMLQALGQAAPSQTSGQQLSLDQVLGIWSQVMQGVGSISDVGNQILAGTPQPTPADKISIGLQGMIQGLYSLADGVSALQKQRTQAQATDMGSQTNTMNLADVLRQAGTQRQLTLTGTQV